MLNMKLRSNPFGEIHIWCFRISRTVMSHFELFLKLSIKANLSSET